MNEAAASNPAEAAAPGAPHQPARRFARFLDAQVWRLASGLVLFAFVLSHFINHALGHFSLDLMETVQVVRRGFWRSAPGTLLLYGAFLVHIGLALAKLVRRRTWRMPLWEAAQIGLGLAIPFLLAAHLAATRGLATFEGVDDTYTVQLRLLWPGLAQSQTVLLLVVWLHACIGLHHWLKNMRWYAPVAPYLLVLAVLVPTLATTGWIESARRVASMSFPGRPLTGEQFAAGGRMIDAVQRGVWLVFGAAFAAALALRVRQLANRGPAVTIAGGRTIRGPRGATLLEIVRVAGVPHAAVCGGRGRCTTCRVAIADGSDTLDPPNAVEAAALRRIDAPQSVRLACQIKPAAPLEVRPLIKLADVGPPATPDAYRWGVERRVTVMFTDLRGFTSVAEHLYPYDSVFLLNRYFEVMAEIVRRHGGEVDKFLGDGIMALFGVAPAPAAGSRGALLAARDMLAALEGINRDFSGAIGRPLRMGIGIHSGPAILGRVGAHRAVGLTALGDTVNIASRLETLNKEFDSVLVVSEATLRMAGLTIPGAKVHEAPLRGRAQGLRVVVAQLAEDLIEAPPAPATAGGGAAPAPGGAPRAAPPG